MYSFKIINMRLYFFLLFFLASSLVFSQDSIRKKIVYESSKTSSAEDVFLANKNLHRRSLSPQEQEELNNYVEQMKVADENSFEHNFYKYLSGRYDVSLFSYLQNASQLKPRSPEVIKQLAAYYIIILDSLHAAETLKMIFEENILSESLLAYGEDVLNSTSKNGTLITHGIEDTYAVEYLQFTKGLRTDVQIISLELLQSSAYREFLKNKEYNFPEQESIDTSFFTAFVELNEDKNMCTALTVPKEYLMNISPNLYTTGLVMRYSTKMIDNFSINKYLWKYQLKYLILKNKNDVKSQELSSNYLLMLFQLRHTFQLKNEKDNFEKVDKIIDEIGVFSGKQEVINRLKLKY